MPIAWLVTHRGGSSASGPKNPSRPSSACSPTTANTARRPPSDSAPIADRPGKTRFLQGALWHLFICLLALFLIRVFLSHWSLLDGAPRNGLGTYLQGQAEKPFAYRWLAPFAVQHLSELLPESLKSWIANGMAPLLHKAFVTPLLAQYEPLLPSITARAQADWDSPVYRLNYTVMVALLWLAAATALAALGRISRQLGNTRMQAALLMLAYTLIYPSVFLHAGYFYDLFEQAFVLLAICCVLQRRWRTFAVVLVVMQCNRETALMLAVLLAPLIQAQIRTSEHKARALVWLALAMAACFAIYRCTQLFFAGNAGASFEFHLFQNLAFWRDPGTWSATYDHYAVGIELPRLLFLACFIPLFVFSITGQRNPMAWSAGLCLAIMSVLFITVGYRDEFRAMGICLPFTLAAVAARLAGPRRTGR